VYPGTFAAKDPDKPALVMADTGETLTYGELEERSARLAHVLRDAGLQKGDAVALLSENDPLYLVAYWAALRSGLYLVAINFHLTAEEQAYILDDCGAMVLLSSAGQAGRAAEIADRAPLVATRLLGDDLDRAVERAADEELDDQPAGADMLYSSGTTGFRRRSSPRSATTRSTSRAASTWRCSSRCSASTRTPSTCRRRRCTTRRRCASAWSSPPPAAPWWR
jgi:fatty-acyl-CoA synthase